MKNAHTQAGNVLFIILLGVVLLGALTMAVRSSMNGGNSTMSDEKLKAAAGEIQQYITAIRQEVQRLMISNDCELNNLDWRNDFYYRSNGNIISITSPSVPKTDCTIFQSQGGALRPISFEAYKDKSYDAYLIANPSSQWKVGHGSFRWVNRQNQGSPANDIAFILEGLDIKLCNYLLNTTSLPSDTFEMGTSAGSAQPSAYTLTDEIIDTPSNLTGEFFGTSITSGGKTYCRLGAIILPQ